MSEPDLQQPDGAAENSPESIPTKRAALRTQQLLEQAEAREQYFKEARHIGEQAGARYGYSTTPENLATYCNAAPSSIAGYMVLAFSPENHMLSFKNRSGRNSLNEKQLRDCIILDPERTLYAAETMGADIEGGSIADNMEQVHRAFSHAKPMTTGRFCVFRNGKIGRFQEKNEIKQNGRGRTVKIKRATFTVHGDIYGGISSQHYAEQKLSQDIQDLRRLNPRITELIAAHMSQVQLSEDKEAFSAQIQDCITTVEKSLGRQANFFYVRKMMIDYLYKLNGGQYDDVRIFWAVKTLRQGMHDRIGKEGTVREHAMILEQEKDVEIEKWHLALTGTKSKRISPHEVLESIHKNFDYFIERMLSYQPGDENRIPAFEPFSGFYRDWQELGHQSYQNKHEHIKKAQRIFVRQYILLTLQEMKLRYAYQESIPPNHQEALKQRIALLNALRKTFFPDLPPIILDFGGKRTRIHETLKREIKLCK